MYNETFGVTFVEVHNTGMITAIYILLEFHKLIIDSPTNIQFQKCCFYFFTE